MEDYIPDYTELHDMYEAEQERAIRKYPRCCCCGEKILDDQLYDVDGKLYHEECFNDEYLKDTDDYVED